MMVARRPLVAVGESSGSYGKFGCPKCPRCRVPQKNMHVYHIYIYIYIHVFTSYKSIQTYKPQIPKKDKPKAPSCLASKSPLAPPTCTADLLTHLNGSRDDDLEEHPRWSGVRGLSFVSGARMGHPLDSWKKPWESYTYIYIYKPTLWDDVGKQYMGEKMGY